jgi:hypothetical protein
MLRRPQINHIAPCVDIFPCPGATPIQLQHIGRAIAVLCGLTRTCDIFHRLRITVEGGAYLTTEQLAAIVRDLIPTDAVDQIFVDGTLLSGIEADMNTGWNGVTVDIPATATVVD